eukprot:g995.t1
MESVGVEYVGSSACWSGSGIGGSAWSGSAGLAASSFEELDLREPNDRRFMESVYTNGIAKCQLIDGLVCSVFHGKEAEGEGEDEGESEGQQQLIGVSARVQEEDAFFAQIVPPRWMADFLFVYEKKRALAAVRLMKPSRAKIEQAREALCGLLYFLGVRGDGDGGFLVASFSAQQVLPHKQQLVRDMEVIDSLVHLLQGALESRRVAPLHESPANSQSKNDDGEKSGEKDELGSEGGSVDAGTADAMNTVCRLAFACMCHAVCGNVTNQLFVHRETGFPALVKQYMEQVRTTHHSIVEEGYSGEVRNLNSWAMHAINEVYRSNDELIDEVDETECRYWLGFVDGTVRW